MESVIHRVVRYDATKRNDPMERFRNEQNMIRLKEPNATLDIPYRCDITSAKMAPLAGKKLSNDTRPMTHETVQHNVNTSLITSPPTAKDENADGRRTHASLTLTNRQRIPIHTRLTF